jgi:hypothetical protein
MRRTSILAGVALGLIGGGGETAAGAAFPSPAAGCSLPALATFHLDPRSYVPLIDGEINGRKVQFIAGVSSATAIFLPAAKALDVEEMPGGQRFILAPGEAMAVGYGWVRDLELNDMPRKVLSSYDVHQDFRILLMDGGLGSTSSPAAVLGAQFWSLADDDLDLNANSITLVRPTGCAPADRLLFNGGAYSQTRLLSGPTTALQDRVAVMVDGVPLEALIDTGAGASILTRQGASKLGHGWPLADAQPQGQLFTGGKRGEIAWSKARFKTFSIGDETIQNPRIAVADLYDLAHEQKDVWKYGDRPHPAAPPMPGVLIPDMILGADFFRAHHVLISNSRRMVYFVYNGAPIFQ